MSTDRFGKTRLFGSVGASLRALPAKMAQEEQSYHRSLSSSGKPGALKTCSKTSQSPTQLTRNPSAPVSDNTKTVGDHVCTFVQTRNGKTASTKFYNKVVCQFKAGDVREFFRGHLAHYVDSTNSHLRRSLLHPDVQRRGCTRLEISLYACDTEDLSQTVAEELIAEHLAWSGHSKTGRVQGMLVKPSSAAW